MLWSTAILAGGQARRFGGRDKSALVVQGVVAPFLHCLLSLTPSADAVVPRTDRGYHPLCAASTRACLAPAAARLADGRLKLSDLLDDVRVHEVSTEEIDAFGDHRRLLATVNTPLEYGGLEALQGHQL